MRQIQEAGSLLLDLLDDILDLSRIESGVHDYTRVPTRLSGLVHGVASALQQRASE